MRTRTALVARLPSPLQRFFELESMGAVLLLLAAVSALALANGPLADRYESFWSVSPALGSWRVGSARHFVSAGLMTVFFAAISLEIKREMVHGPMRAPRYAALPVIAALGGMVIPALMYLAINHGAVGARGWAVPIATDVAFAVGLLVALRRWVGEELTVFLLTLAVFDDVGTILVIALVFGGTIHAGSLLLAAAVAGIYAAGQRRRDGPALWLAAGCGVLLWVLLSRSGVHPTMAGVALGLLTRARVRPDEAQSPVEKWERALHPVSSRLVVPVFALANAGVQLSPGALRGGTTTIFAGIVLALVVGKPLGIVAAAWLAVRLRIGRLPDGVSWRRFCGVACAAGIGFTVSLFVAELAFAGVAAETARLAVLTASIVAAVLSAVILAASRPVTPGAQSGNDTPKP